MLVFSNAGLIEAAPLMQEPAAPDFGATTYNTGQDLTFDEGG